MDYRERLVRFMEAKAKKLEEVGINPKLYFDVGINPELYFNEEDKEDILSWSEEEAKKVYRKLKDNIYSYLILGLDSSVCPFCIKYTKYTESITPDILMCHKCSYAERHGKCDNESSHYRIITNILKIKDLRPRDIFTPDFYKSLIDSEIDYRRYLIEFMKAKAEKLAEYGVDRELYFNEEDKKDILSWPKKDAEKVWYKLKENINVRESEALSSGNCPFCIRYDILLQKHYLYCCICVYAKNHNGECKEDGSDLRKITRILKKKSIPGFEELPNSWYKEIINKIESK